MSESQTPTPRTDAVMRLHAECKSKMATPANEHVLRRHVEELERDLTAARAEVERLRKAVEFAEYMAKGAEQFQEITDVMATYYVEDEEDPPQHVLDHFGDLYSGLKNDIYEFRKRAALAAKETK